MESSLGVDSISDKGCGSPLKHCIDLCTLLAGKGMRFTISVKIDNSFAFTLKSENAEAPRAQKRSPSYLRRQERRRLLKKKLVSSPAEPTNTREEDDTLNTREEDDTLEKGKYPRYPDGYYYCPIDYSTPEEESDNDKISLDLSPHLTRHPGCAEVSEGSVESDPDETKMEPGGADDLWMLATPKSHRKIRREKRS